jgi:K+-sensing histidine kinase KdpD
LNKVNPTRRFGFFLFSTSLASAIIATKPTNGLPGKHMGIVNRVTPVAVVLAIVAAVTAILWLIRSLTVGPQHLVFFYLLPTAVVATFYGSLPAMLCAVAATLCAAFFLYDPLYSFYVISPVEVGELICFVGLALIGAKCAADLLQPLLSWQQQNPAAEE